MNRRLIAAAATALALTLTGCSALTEATNAAGNPDAADVSTTAAVKAAPGTALSALKTLPVKGKAPKTGYKRDQFGQAWKDVDRNGCDTRNDILNRDLTNKTVKNCRVYSGTRKDPYTATTIQFVRGGAYTNGLDIDHVVALSAAWVTGAQYKSKAAREAIANDPLNLMAVSPSQNRQKGDGDAATWLPKNKGYRCEYVARQIAVKVKYGLWVTSAEKDAMTRILTTCPTQKVPTGGLPAVK